MDTLEAQIKGWERRGVYDDPRLTQILKMYEEIGFIVKIEPVRPEIEAGCTECTKENPDKYYVLYTKKNDPE
ncbi:MAG: hypothetical protein H8D87_21065 [Deltaproteobacteria bacterium]|uniref:hypothetical protein n=1 Tax=Desulfobacula sp. TaxID=2593537 RepID=UPI001985AD7B|nr:hypothetical protein [Candidatus Desulfobacula maris]MBL6992548.1 hypothetical protein [Desulfobacula sp.]